MKVVVTGGSGFVGRRLQLVKPDWIYLSSSDLNLLDYNSCVEYLHEVKPDAVVHLAGRVGGIKDNSEHPAEFYQENILLNTNIVKACAKVGVKRLLASLSTCSFPDVAKEYPFSESCILDGPPAKTNIAYGFSKRAMYIHILSCRDQYGLDYSCFCPSNLYGPEDCFDLQKSHFLPAAIRKLHEAKDGDVVEFWGTGDPKRQQLFVDDLCKAIPELLDKHHSEAPIIVAPDNHHSILEMVYLCRTMIGKEVVIEFNGKLDGQKRKDGSNKVFRELLPEFQFTSLKDGLKKTYDWYKTSVHNRD